MADEQRPRRGLQDGNDRVASLARWLKEAPDTENVQELVLEAWVGDEEPEQVRRWPKGKVVRELATEINDLINDFAVDNGTTIYARLRWVRVDNGQPWLAKKFRAACPKNLQETVMPLDGSSASFLSANQRHTEVAFKMLAEVVDRSEAKLLDIMDRDAARTERMFGFFDRMLERLDSRATAAEEVADTAAQQISEAEELAEEATKAAEDAIERAEAAGDDDKVAKVFDIAIRKLTEG